MRQQYWWSVVIRTPIPLHIVNTLLLLSPKLKLLCGNMDRFRERCTVSYLRPHNPRSIDFKCFWTNSIRLSLSSSYIPAFQSETPRSDHLFPSCVLYTVRKLFWYQLLLVSYWLPDSLTSFESIVLSDVSWTPRLNSRSVFMAGQSFPLGKRMKCPPFLGSLYISCSMRLCGDLRLLHKSW